VIIIRFLLLIIILNILRYLVIGLIEEPLILPYLFSQMEINTEYFNTDFQTLDWLTSYFYNFIMWLVVVWVFHILHPQIKGNFYIKSLKVFGIMCLFFISISAIYMNHYSHPKAFYFWNMLDAVMVYTLLAILNGFFYPILIKNKS